MHKKLIAIFISFAVDLVAGGPRPADKPACSTLLPMRRQACGADLGKENCEAKGCCWDDSLPFVISCYRKDYCEHANPGEREDCGGGGRAKCLARGCCFDRKFPGTNWCYYKKVSMMEEPTCSSTQPTRRLDCGGGGKEKCLARGCCFDRSIRGVNWCFHKDVCSYENPERRIDCGGGLGKFKCEELGCCWDDRTPGVNWCFHKTDVPFTRPECPGNKIYTQCASSCPDSCEKRHDICTTDCDLSTQCVCPTGTIEITTGSDHCVKPSQCRIPESPTCSALLPERREDCGRGLGKYKCEAKGCCWDESTPGVNWCYRKSSCEDIKPEDREDCGGGLGKERCEAKGCCWDDRIRGVNWCFHRRVSMVEQPTCSNTHPERRLDCGKGGRLKCLARGCCFDNSVRGVNWCFYKDVCVYEDPKKRTDCGGGLGRVKCEAMGCCWDDRTPGVNWCFHKTDVPPSGPVCKGNKIFTECAPSCRDSCEKRHAVCTADCDPSTKCVCPPGTVEITAGSDYCINPSKCRKPESPTCSANILVERQDCGNSLGQDKCEAKGCCWDDTIPGSNWCYRKTSCVDIKPEERQDCGGGLGKTKCEAKGCCWDDRIRGVNWCFRKTVSMVEQPTCSNTHPERRLDCGRGGKARCLARGCCFDSSIRGVNWCFYKDVCNYEDPQNRVDCGSDLGKDKCEAMGCCWDDRTLGVNWCFHKADVTTPSPPPTCPGIKIFTNCASVCQDSCEKRYQSCTYNCDLTNNCICPEGTVELVAGSDICVKPTDCPAGSCPFGVKGPLQCDEDLCKGAVCSRYPSAKCRVNNCGTCHAEFYVGDHVLLHVDCMEPDYGVCPGLASAIPVCIEACTSDQECYGGRCCFTGCGHRCH